jgi:HEAT repeat protein
MGLFPPRRPRIERLRRRGDVAGLCDALAYCDPVRMRDGETVDLGAPVRRRAMAALREIDDDRAVAGAVEALEDDDEEVRLEAVRALRQRRIADPLIGCLVRSSAGLPEQVRAEVHEALHEMDGPGLGVSFAGRLIRDGGEALTGDDDRRFLEALLSSAPVPERQDLARAAAQELAGDDEPRRERAFLVLSVLGDTGLEALHQALGQPQRAVAAAAALGRLHDSGALPALVDLLGDGQAPVRAAAARALGEIRDPRAVERLLAASTDSEFVVREAASEALDKLGTSAIVFAVAAFVRPLLAAGTDARIEPAHEATEARVPELPSAPALPDVPASAPPGRPAGTFDRLRRAARRARAPRQDG